jgi:hypothetical protein
MFKLDVSRQPLLKLSTLVCNASQDHDLQTLSTAAQRYQHSFFTQSLITSIGASCDLCVQYCRFRRYSTVSMTANEICKALACILFRRAHPLR